MSRCPTCGRTQRTGAQNNGSFAIYTEIAKNRPEDNALGWRCYCKLHFGVPILRAEDEGFRKWYDELIKGQTYERKLMFMEHIPVTSLMTQKQFSDYLDRVIAEFPFVSLPDREAA